MRNKLFLQGNFFLICIATLLLSGCAGETQDMSSNDESYNGDLPLYHGQAPYSSSYSEGKYASLLPQHLDTNQRTILVDPKAYAWGAYDADGTLVRAGIASAGADFCKDEGHPCRTTVGTFHVYSMGDEGCASKIYPIPKGGALMPYCMFFHNGESLHGSPDPMLVEANISHGCIHMRIPDAEWLRYNFVNVGTKVIIEPY